MCNVIRTIIIIIKEGVSGSELGSSFSKGVKWKDLVTKGR